ncbi:hypothetical protein NECAME_17334, partial [Necator americanus]
YQSWLKHDNSKDLAHFSAGDYDDYDYHVWYSIEHYDSTNVRAETYEKTGEQRTSFLKARSFVYTGGERSTSLLRM